MVQRDEKAAITIQDELPLIIRMLRKPAGDDPRFATPENIDVNREAFREEVHATWKRLHARALDELLTIEQVLRSPSSKRFPRDFVWFLEYTMAIWRRVNDAIVWSMLGAKDHFIRILCHRKERPRLTEANPVALRRLVDHMNQDPSTFALWSDATSCIDVGDIVCRSFSGKHPDGIYEVKEGKVNDRIFDLLHSRGDQKGLESEIETFADEYGPKGMKQIGRVIRQRQTYNQVLDILEYDRGFDPRRQENIVVQGVDTQLESYDEALQKIIDESVESPVLRCIDRCLWIYVDQDTSKGIREGTEAFATSLSMNAPEVWHWFKKHYGENARFEPIALDGNLACPEAIPLFLRQLKAETVRDVLVGRLMGRVLLFLDWEEYGRIIKDLGAELAWSSIKAGRAQRSKPRWQQVLTFGGRIPRVQLPNGRYIEGFSKIYRVFVEGLSPSSVAAPYVEALRSELPLGGQH
jgi:hypothetical protein